MTPISRMLGGLVNVIEPSVPVAPSVYVVPPSAVPYAYTLIKPVAETPDALLLILRNTSASSQSLEVLSIAVDWRWFVFPRDVMVHVIAWLFVPYADLT